IDRDDQVAPIGRTNVRSDYSSMCRIRAGVSVVLQRRRIVNSGVRPWAVTVQIRERKGFSVFHRGFRYSGEIFAVAIRHPTAVWSRTRKLNRRIIKALLFNVRQDVPQPGPAKLLIPGSMRACREMLVDIVIVMQGNPDLLQIVLALSAGRSFAY